MNFAMRRLSEALLFALLLLAVQTAILTHDHGDNQAPAGLASQSCEFCSGSHAGAPAPDHFAAAHHEPSPIFLPDASGGPARSVRASAAHRTRAPPVFRSI